ncbi:MAG: ABC transporter ATP-binding protein [Phycisphaeraceae bacterium]|nr:ABC transporter ATP-binding protein [Phycisphaeraceae bacterium]
MTTAAPPSAQTIVSVSNLHKTYRLGRVDVPVLRGVSLDVRRGEWLAIRGASGSGKSTLLHLIGGLDRPDRGAGSTIRFRDSVLSDLRAGDLDQYRATNVGFVFQFYHLLPELTVLQNVTIASMVRDGLGHKSSAATDKAKALLTTFGLGERLRHRPAELSGGERQRVAIARALINDPDVLLADEPTGNLDRATGDKILDALAKVRAERGQTMIMVTHDAEVASRADRVVNLTDGRIVG